MQSHLPRTVCLIGVLALLPAAVQAEPNGNVFSPEFITATIHKANAWQLAHPWRPDDHNWIRATWYTGVMAANKATGDEAYLRQAADWARKHQWQVGSEQSGANKLFCTMTYLELYLLEREEAKIEPMVRWLDTDAPNSPGGAKIWYGHAPAPHDGPAYSDSLYGAPALSLLYQANGDEKYLEILHDFFWDVTEKTLDKQDSLYYRDARFIGQKTTAGRKVFWSRGNGWVFGAFPRLLETLPQDDPERRRYVALFQKMAESLVKRQGLDGLWRPNLDDPTEFPMPETSGTGFFCYGLAWGVRQGILDRDTYLPAVKRAWKGLVRCLSDEGKVQWGQLVGHCPVAVEQEHTHEYVTGTFLLAGSEVLNLISAGVLPGDAPSPTEPPLPETAVQTREMPLWDGFPRLKAPKTGREAVQLTSGEAFCYPLYYFIPTITSDAKHLIYHRAGDGQVQLHRLNLRTGQSAQLTRGTCPKTQWRYWCVESGRGVLDHRSVLNVARNEVVYFDGNCVHQVDVETLDDQVLFTLPDDREAIGQNCVTPDGQWLVYIDAPAGSSRRHPCQGAKVVGFHFDTREQRVLATIDVAIHHVAAYDNRHFIFCHPPGHNGIMITDLSGDGRYTELRVGDPGARGYICHHLMTRRGIAYEVSGLGYSGLYDPFTRRRFEFKLPPDLGYVHTGWDPEGRLWFYECAGKIHQMIALVALGEDGQDQWLQLCGDWPTFGGGQKSHFHPQLTPDRKWILFNAGDPATETNHLFLLDASDLKEVVEISPAKLSWSGANDMTRALLPEALRAAAIPVGDVKASGFKPSYGPENAIDGELETLWSAEGDGQWIQFDLGETKPVGRILISWYAGDKRRQRFQVEASGDGDQWKTVFDGTSSGSSAGPEPCGVQPFRARYLRVVGQGNSANSWNSMRELLILAE